MKTKYCARCEQTLTVENFTTNSSRYDGFQPYCQECMKLYRKEYYSRNKPSHYKRNQKAFWKLRKFVVDLKNSSACSNCGIKYPDEPWLLEFNHRDPTTKSCAVSSIIQRKGTMKKLLAEISKCDLLCLICHRRETARQMNWQLNRFIGAKC